MVVRYRGRKQWLRVCLLSAVALMPLAAKKPYKPFTVEKVRPESSTSGVSLCAVTDRYFSDADPLAARPYLTLHPKEAFGLTLSYDEICLTHLAPRTTYTLTIDKRIPLGEDRIDRTYTFTKKTEDIDPSVVAKGNGYILPSKGEITIPVETTNVTKLAVTLYRVTTKNLIHMISRYGLFQSVPSYRLNRIAQEEGYRLWHKTLRVANRPNQTVRTAIPVGSMLAKHEPGVYILEANRIDKNGKELDDNHAIQWFMVSDIGLSVTEGSEGIDVEARRLSTAQYYGHVRFDLIAYNNEVLANVSSKNGQAHFPAAITHGKNGLRPKAIYAYGEKGDFSVLDLSRPAFDLSDRGDVGRKNMGKYQVMLYSNRGIFRPGERLPYRLLVRNTIGDAVAGFHGAVKLYDGRDALLKTQTFVTDASGYAAGHFSLPTSAGTGKWRLKIYADTSKPIETLPFLVEDFVPPKVALNLKNIPLRLHPGEVQKIQLLATYLTGEVLPNVPVEVTTILHKASHPFPTFPGYHFGDSRHSYRNEMLPSHSVKIDNNGSALLSLKIDKKPRTTLPVSAHVTLTLSEPGGRPVEKNIEIFYACNKAYLGIKPQFDGDHIDEGASARFSLIALHDGALMSAKLHYRLVQEEQEWNWRNRGDGWEYYVVHHDQGTIKEGLLALRKDQPTELNLAPLPWGDYRLEVDQNGSSLSTYRFSSGYSAELSRAVPDRLPVSVDKKFYAPGETLRVHIVPKFSGPVTVKIASNHILKTKTFTAIQGKAIDTSFTVQPSWGSSAYVLAAAYRPAHGKLGANRAIGLAHIAIQDPARRISVQMDAPERLRSQSTLTVHLHTKAKGHDPIFLTLAAVDEGVLNLTGYHKPDPVSFFLGDRKLGVTLRDLYGNLITPSGAHAEFDVGAGDDEPVRIQKHVTSSKREIIAFLTPRIACDADGNATATFSVPDYQGKLSLMALAWSRHGLGEGNGSVVIQDPVSSEAYLPRFLSMGDQAWVHIETAFDSEVAAGTYSLVFQTDGGLRILGDSHKTFDHAAGKKDRFLGDIQIEAADLKDGNLSLSIRNPKGQVVATRHWDLGIRAAYPQNYVRTVEKIDPGQTIAAATLIASGKWRAPHDLRLSVSSGPLLPADAYVRQLREYSLRCAEQTSSRAVTLLNVPRAKQTVRNRQDVREAIAHLETLQRVNGGFGLWGGSRMDLWVSAYVMDFWLRAREAGYSVPKKNIQAGLQWLERNLDRWSTDPIVQAKNAYALYILARAGRTLISPMRSLSKSTHLHSAAGWAYLAAAFSYVGEQKVARSLFTKAKHALGNSGKGVTGLYGGVLRDEGLLIALMTESGLKKEAVTLYTDLAKAAQKRRYLSTQELAVLLRAYRAAGISSGPLELAVNGRLVHHLRHWSAKAKQPSALPKIRNRSSHAVWYDLNYIATPVPESNITRENNGFTLKKNIYTIDGHLASLSDLAQKSRLIVVIRGRIERQEINHPLLTDWVPAGFEIENPDISGSDVTESLPWIKHKTPLTHTAYRADRFEAAWVPQDSNNTLVLAYAVRAVTRGTFTLPPTRIVDMYQPYYHAFSPLYRHKILIRNPLPMAAPAKARSETNATQKAQPITLTSDRYRALFRQPVGDLTRYTITQLNFLRNGIFAQAGLDFSRSNPMLYKRFSAFDWYKPTTTRSGEVYVVLTPLQKRNVQKLLSEEKRRGGGLVLADFYRIHTRAMTQADLQRYDKQSLRILRNSLIARYGYRFREPELMRVFRQMPWYHPTDITTQEVLDEKMSVLERENIRQILAAEHAR